MILFKDWNITVTGLVARQYDNLSRRIDIEGDLPEGYDWQLLVQSGGDADTLLLQPTETGVGAVLTADNLSKSGEYYFQLRGVLQSDGTTRRHTNIVSSFIPQSLTGLGTWPEVPTEFAQIEQRCATAMIAAESAAESARDDASRVDELAAETAENAEKTALAAAAAMQAKESSETAQNAAETSESAAKASEKSSAESASSATKSAAAAQMAQIGAEDAQVAAEQSAKKAAESAAVYDTVSVDITQLKETTAANTPDDTVVNGKPWTSKKIVDSLCQPIEESGNPVQCYPVENYPLGVKVHIEPTQEGNGDPSPDNIRPITGMDTVSVTRCGKNLLHCTNKSQNDSGIEWEESEDGTFRIKGQLASGVKATAFDLDTATKDNIFAAIRSRMTLAVSGLPTGVSLAVYDKNWIGAGGATITFPANMGYPSNTYFQVRSSELTFDHVFTPQIELGSTATAYEPYTGSKTDIALPETVYGGTLDVQTGVLTCGHFLITLTGEEKSHIFSKMFYLDGIEAPRHLSNNAGISSHYPYDLYGNKSIGVVKNGNSVVYRPYGYYSPDESGMSQWKAYLASQYAAGTPVQVCYKIETPYTIQLTPQQITALPGVNTIYTDANGVIVTGVEDPKHTITELKNAIISLGGNV